MNKPITLLLKNYRILPVIVIDNETRAAGTIEALLEGGLPIAEVTMRTPAALAVIEIASSRYPDMVVGAGTVLSAENATAAITAGARFIVSPGFSQEVLDVCNAHAIPYYPGVATSTEIQTALSKGLSILKFFPAEQLGGLPTISALSAAFVGLEFVPTGGIGKSNYLDYLKHPQVPIIGGSWIAPRRDINEGNYPEIIANAKRALTDLNSQLKS